MPSLKSIQQKKAAAGQSLENSYSPCSSSENLSRSTESLNNGDYESGHAGQILIRTGQQESVDNNLASRAVLGRSRSIKSSSSNGNLRRSEISLSNKQKGSYSKHKLNEMEKKRNKRKQLQERSAQVVKVGTKMNEQDISKFDKERILLMQQDYQEFLKCNAELEDDRIGYQFEEEELNEITKELKIRAKDIKTDLSQRDKTIRQLEKEQSDIWLENETLLYDRGIDLEKWQKKRNERDAANEKAIEACRSNLKKLKHETTRLLEELEQKKLKMKEVCSNTDDTIYKNINDTESTLEKENKALQQEYNQLLSKKIDVLEKTKKLERQQKDLDTDLESYTSKKADLKQNNRRKALDIQKQQDEKQRLQFENARFEKKIEKLCIT